VKACNSQNLVFVTFYVDCLTLWFPYYRRRSNWKHAHVLLSLLSIGFLNSRRYRA